MLFKVMADLRHILIDLLFQGLRVRKRALFTQIAQKLHAEFAAVKVAAVADPTGAGDAYRAGLIKGLHSGLDMETSAELGSVCSSFCIEKYGTQEHGFTRDSFARRYEEAYGPMPALPW